MRGTAAVTLALALACSVVPTEAQQQRDVKPTIDAVGEKGTGSVTGTVKTRTDKGIVIVGREMGKNDREWSFVFDADTRIAAGDQARGASDLREGDPVTVTYANREGKVVAQSVTVNNR